jgi:hypothetical protein
MEFETHPMVEGTIHIRVDWAGSDFSHSSMTELVAGNARIDGDRLRGFMLGR